MCFSALCKRHLWAISVSIGCGEFNSLSLICFLPRHLLYFYNRRMPASAHSWNYAPRSDIFFIGTNSTFLKKYMYFIFDISLFIKLRTSPLLESYLAMKFLFHHLHLSHIPASLPNLWFSVLNTKRSSVGL